MGKNVSPAQAEEGPEGRSEATGGLDTPPGRLAVSARSTEPLSVVCRQDTAQVDNAGKARAQTEGLIC